MEKNEILKTSINQNCDFGKNGFFYQSDLYDAIDSLDLTQNSASKVKLCKLIKNLIIASWKSESESSLKMVIKEINLLAEKGNNYGKVQ